MEEAPTAAQNPLVAITFQKNIDRKKKYLEAEPKALGVPSVRLCKRLNETLKVVILETCAASVVVDYSDWSERLSDHLRERVSGQRSGLFGHRYSFLHFVLTGGLIKQTESWVYEN